MGIWSLELSPVSVIPFRTSARTKSQPMFGVLFWTKLSGTIEVYTACSKLSVLKLDGLDQVVF